MTLIELYNLAFPGGNGDTPVGVTGSSGGTQGPFIRQVAPKEGVGYTRPPP